MGKFLFTVLAITTAWSGAVSATGLHLLLALDTDAGVTAPARRHDIENLSPVDRHELQRPDPALERAYRMMDAIPLQTGCPKADLPSHRAVCTSRLPETCVHYPR